MDVHAAFGVFVSFYVEIFSLNFEYSKGLGNSKHFLL
jgi:hypothetical protein